MLPLTAWNDSGTFVPTIHVRWLPRPQPSSSWKLPSEFSGDKTGANYSFISNFCSSLTFLLSVICASSLLLSHRPAFMWPAHRALCTQAVLLPITHTTLSHLPCLLKSVLILACSWQMICTLSQTRLTTDLKNQHEQCYCYSKHLPNSSHHCSCSFLDAPWWVLSQPMADHCPLIFSISN